MFYLAVTTPVVVTPIEEPLKPVSLSTVPMVLRQDMKRTANDVLLKIQELLGTSIVGINDYVESDGLQNAEASKTFVLRLLREKDKHDTIASSTQS